MTAQSFTLGLSRAVGASGTLSGTLQVPSILQTLTLLSDDDQALVSSIRVANQRIDVTDQSMPVGMFSPAYQGEGFNSIGIPLARQQVVSVDFTQAATTNVIAGSVNTDAINDEDVVPISQLGDALSYAGGLGVQQIADGGTDKLSATIRRNCRIGRLCLVAGDNLNLQVTSILINNVEQLSGAAGDTVPAATYSPVSTDQDGNTLDAYVSENDVIEVFFSNPSGAAITVSGGFYCLPM